MLRDVPFPGAESTALARINTSLGTAADEALADSGATSEVKVGARRLARQTP